MENTVNKINDDIEALILNHDQISNLAEKFVKTKDMIMNDIDKIDAFINETDSCSDTDKNTLKELYSTMKVTVESLDLNMKTMENIKHAKRCKYYYKGYCKNEIHVHIVILLILYAKIF